MANAAEEEWKVLAGLFPEGWREQAQQTGAIKRQRGITDPESLLRLFLLHVARGYSLRETVVRAKETGLAAISDVGLLKRLRRSEEWLHWLCMRLVQENGVRMPGGEQRAVRIVDFSGCLDVNIPVVFGRFHNQFFRGNSIAWVKNN